MPLSEHEQKMLDEMERQLFAEDPQLARAFRRSGAPRRDRRRITLGLIGVVAGLGLLVLAVALPAIWLGVLAFLLMLAGALYAVTSPVRQPSGAAGPGGTESPSAQGPRQARREDAAAHDFMRRLEERWERRSGPDQPR